MIVQQVCPQRMVTVDWQYNNGVCIGVAYRQIIRGHSGHKTRRRMIWRDSDKKRRMSGQQEKLVNKGA